jgi:hypothetical protein
MEHNNCCMYMFGPETSYSLSKHKTDEDAWMLRSEKRRTTIFAKKPGDSVLVTKLDLVKFL